MKLLLCRHSKTEPATGAVADHERTLTERGRSDAALLARALLERNLVPTRILASDSTRTKETTDVFLSIWRESGTATAVQWEPRLYAASAENVIAVIADNGKSEPIIMVVGHNPTMEELASDLSRTSVHLKTSSVAAFDLPGKSWHEVDPSRRAEAELIHVR